MQDISKFIVENWKLLAGGFLAILSIIIQCFKKRPDANSVSGFVNFIISELLPAYIRKAEVKFSDGSEKKNFVLQSAMHELRSYCVLDESARSLAVKQFSKAIELYLSTPQRKPTEEEF